MASKKRQFSISTLFWIVVFSALASCWFMDHRTTRLEMERLNQEITTLKSKMQVYEFFEQQASRARTNF